MRGTCEPSRFDRTNSALDLFEENLKEIYVEKIKTKFIPGVGLKF